MPQTTYPNILIISCDSSTAGAPSTQERYSSLSKVLGKQFSVTSATVHNGQFKDNASFGLDGMHTSANAMDAIVCKVDAILIDGRLIRKFHFLRDADVPIAVDLYDPMIADDIAIWREQVRDTILLKDERASIIRDQLTIGDFFLCSNEAQQDYWLGMLSAYNRINPVVYAHDKTMSNLLAVLPWGIADSPSLSDTNRLRAVIPGINKSDKLAVWILDDLPWLDPTTLIQAVAELGNSNRRLKVAFLFQKPTLSSIRSQARKISDELGLTNRRVFFVDCDEDCSIEQYLQEADFGVSLQKDSFEAQIVARPEIISYIGAGLPVLVTKHNAEMVADYSLGQVVLEEDVHAVSRGLQQFLAVKNLRQSFRDSVRQIATELSWENVSQPLVQWFVNPRRAPDKLAGYVVEDISLITDLSPTQAWALPGRALHYLKTTGVPGLAAEMRSYISWKLTDYRR